MPIEELRRLVLRIPFLPFRLHVADGSSYEIRRREMILLGARSVTIGVPGPDDPYLYDHTVIVALVHVTRLELLASDEPADQSVA